MPSGLGDSERLTICSFQTSLTGDYTVRVVDSLAIRDLTLDLEEFGLYAINNDFPEVVPEDEIWISERLPIAEFGFAAAGIMTRLHALQQGEDEDKAYDRGLAKEKSERSKATARFESRPKQGDEDTPKLITDDTGYVHIAGDGSEEPVHVYMVDADIVRTYFKTDFLEGGNGAVYDFVPKDQIWIESDLNRVEMPLIALHEYTERLLMLRRGLDYDKAHQLASKVEFSRRGTEFTQADVAKLTPAILDEVDGKAKKPAPETKALELPVAATPEERAKKVDLIYLPEGIDGTRCANCMWIRDSYCHKSEVDQPIPEPDKMCCGVWDQVGTKRPWEEAKKRDAQPAANGQPAQQPAPSNGQPAPKAMSAYAETSGGALVAPARFAVAKPRRKNWLPIALDKIKALRRRYKKDLSIQAKEDEDNYAGLRSLKGSYFQECPRDPHGQCLPSRRAKEEETDSERGRKPQPPKVPKRKPAVEGPSSSTAGGEGTPWWQRLIDAAKQIPYSKLFWHMGTKVVWVQLPRESKDEEKTKKLLQSMEFAKEYKVEYEAAPPMNDGWHQLYPVSRQWKEPLEEGVSTKSLVEYNLKRWITIGGQPAEHGGRHEEHHGGTPVKIDDATGEVEKGPKKMRGKKVKPPEVPPRKEKGPEKATEQKPAEQKPSEKQPEKKSPDQKPVEKVEEKPVPQQPPKPQQQEMVEQKPVEKKPAQQSQQPQQQPPQSQKPEEEVPPAPTWMSREQTEVYKGAMEVAKRMNYPFHKITWFAERGPEFVVAGTKFHTAADCDLTNGNIRMFADSMTAFAPEAMAHEVMHGRFQDVFNEYGIEKKQPGGGPIYDRLAKYLRGDGWAKLRNEDGVSPYSEAYWQDPKVLPSIKVHETLAEIARGEQLGLTWGKPMFRGLYDAVNEIYNTLHGKR